MMSSYAVPTSRDQHLTDSETSLPAGRQVQNDIGIKKHIKK